MTDTVKLLTLMSDAERAQWERMAENDRLASITDWIIPPQAMKDPEPFTLSVSASSGRLDTLYIGVEAEIPTPDHNWRELYSAEVQHAGRWFEKCVALQAQMADRDREITALRAERDLWKGLHGDLVAKFSAVVPTPEPKPAPEHDPFRNFSGDPRRLGR